MVQLEKTDNVIVCKSQTCKWRKDCAQHVTAGHNQSKSGYSPDVQVIPECGEGLDTIYVCDEVICNHRYGRWRFRTNGILDNNLP